MVRQVLHPALDVCHKATLHLNQPGTNCPCLSLPSRQPCVHQCDERTDDAQKLGQLCHLKVQAGSQTQNETPLSAQCKLQDVVSRRGIFHPLCHFKYVNTNLPNLQTVEKRLRDSQEAAKNIHRQDKNRRRTKRRENNLRGRGTWPKGAKGACEEASPRN